MDQWKNALDQSEKEGRGAFLDVRDGTKGGRERCVWVPLERVQEVREVIERVREVCRAGKIIDAAGLKKALELKPDHVNALTNLGKLEMDLKRYDQAEAHLKKALSLDPKCVPAAHNLGLCLMNQGRDQEAHPLAGHGPGLGGQKLRPGRTRAAKRELEAVLAAAHGQGQAAIT